MRIAIYIATKNGQADNSQVVPLASGGGTTETLLQPKPPHTRKLERRAAKIQPSYRVQQVNLNAFNPPKSKAPISTEIDADACAGWRQPDPPAVNREVLADGRRGQRCGHLRDGTHDRRDKRVRIGPRPDTVVVYIRIRKIPNRLAASAWPISTSAIASSLVV